MAVSGVVKKILETSEELLNLGIDPRSGVQDDDFRDAMEELISLGEEANGNTAEYRILKDMVVAVEDFINIKIDRNPEIEKPKLCYFGIKNCGGRWYSEKDQYTLGFENVDECAKHFNG